MKGKKKLSHKKIKNEQCADEMFETLENEILLRDFDEFSTQHFANIAWAYVFLKFSRFHHLSQVDILMSSVFMFCFFLSLFVSFFFELLTCSRFYHLSQVKILKKSQLFRRRAAKFLKT